MNKIVSLLLKILLTLLILFLAWRLYDEIFSPWQFDKAKKARYKAVKEHMDEIVKAQDAFKEATGKFAGDFDTLGLVLKNDSLREIRSIGVTADTVVVMGVDKARDFFDIEEDLTGEPLFKRLSSSIKQYNEQLRKEGGDQITSYKVEDTSYVSISKTLDIKSSIDSLRYIPYSKGDTFHMEAKILTEGLGRLEVPVYEVIAKNKSILKGLDERYWHKEAGIKLGSLNEATTDIREFDPGEEDED